MKGEKDHLEKTKILQTWINQFYLITEMREGGLITVNGKYDYTMYSCVLEVQRKINNDYPVKPKLVEDGIAGNHTFSALYGFLYEELYQHGEED